MSAKALRHRRQLHRDQKIGGAEAAVNSHAGGEAATQMDIATDQRRQERAQPPAALYLCAIGRARMSGLRRMDGAGGYVPERAWGRAGGNTGQGHCVRGGIGAGQAGQTIEYGDVVIAAKSPEPSQKHIEHMTSAMGGGHAGAADLAKPQGWMAGKQGSQFEQIGRTAREQIGLRQPHAGSAHEVPTVPDQQMLRVLIERLALDPPQIIPMGRARALFGNEHLMTQAKRRATLMRVLRQTYLEPP